MADQTVPVPVDLLRRLRDASLPDFLDDAIRDLVALIPPPRKRPTEAAVTAYCERRYRDTTSDQRRVARDHLESAAAAGLLHPDALEDDADV